MGEYNTLQPWQTLDENGLTYDVTSLYGHFHQLSDPRGAKGKRYSLVMLLTVIFLAKLAGKDKPDEIADWAQNHAEEIASLLQLPRPWMPSHSTIRRVFHSVLDAGECDHVVQAYHLQEHPDMGEVLALDGKVLRGTRQGGQAEPDQVLSVYAVDTHAVLAQHPVDTKENEITVAPRTLAAVPVAGKIVTGDALHTQRTLSAQLAKCGGHYLWPVKENQPAVYDAIQRLFTPATPLPGFGQPPPDFLAVKTTNYGHGRLEKRTLQTSTMLNTYLDWPGLAQVYRLERTISWVRQGQVYKTSHQIEYGLTSLSRSQATPTKVLQVRRKHWLIETGLHYRRDVTFREDATRMTKGTAGRNLATIHNLVLGLLKRAGYTNAAKARRYYEGHMDEALCLLITTKSHS